jgi:hypothetical protein
MKSKKHPAWLVIEPAIGLAVAGIIGWQWTKGAVAAAWSKL